jgi:hypothetical protein
MRAIKFISVLLTASSVAACSADSGPKEAGGTAGGAFTGAFIGNLIGGSAGNRVAGTLIGAAVGGFLRSPGAMAMSCPVLRRKSTAPPAGNTRIRSISTGGRRSNAAPPAAIPTALGRP